MVFPKLQKIFLILFIFNFCINSTSQVENVKKLKAKDDSFELRLVYWYSVKWFDKIKFVNFDNFKAITLSKLNISNLEFKNLYVIKFLPKRAKI